jgi:hypothetical protein
MTVSERRDWRVRAICARQVARIALTPVRPVVGDVADPVSHESEAVDAPECRLLHLPLAKPGGDIPRRAA